jgi:diadenosine tetraphosphate (Ap4A) HIT family hydrolase
MHHFRTTRKKYEAQITANSKKMCPFCDPETRSKTVRDFKDFYIVKNIVEYDVWELHNVVEHLLLVPKKHAENLNVLSDSERLEFMNIIAEYESDGYNIYARGVKSERRSIVHQHTHLIKTRGKQAYLSLFSRKPYFLWKV